MANYLSAAELERTAPAETASFNGRIPIQIVSNGEFTPFPQTREQQRVEARVKELATELAPKHGMSRRRFLASSAGMAAALPAMNEVFGHVFDVATAEAQTPGVADENARALAGPFIFDLEDVPDIGPLTSRLVGKWSSIRKGRQSQRSLRVVAGRPHP